MNKRVETLWVETTKTCIPRDGDYVSASSKNIQEFAELIAKDCIHYIETHRIPVGNSAAGEMACEWTYDALKSIRGKIKEHFGIKD